MTTQPENDGRTADEPLFPIFLKLTGRKVVLVGGGPVAVAKASTLRAAGARITVVAPAVDPALGAPEAGVAEILVRPFQASDLDGAWFVVAAAPPEVNRQVLAAAEARHLFVNAVDDPAAATAYAAGVVRRGPVTVAISTGGQAPALAGLLREGIEAVLPDDLDRWAAAARAAREAWKRAGVPMVERRPLLLQALNRLYDDRDPAGEGTSS